MFEDDNQIFRLLLSNCTQNLCLFQRFWKITKTRTYYLFEKPGFYSKIALTRVGKIINKLFNQYSPSGLRNWKYLVFSATIERLGEIPIFLELNTIGFPVTPPFNQPLKTSFDFSQLLAKIHRYLPFTKFLFDISVMSDLRDSTKNYLQFNYTPTINHFTCVFHQTSNTISDLLRHCIRIII